VRGGLGNTVKHSTQVLVVANDLESGREIDTEPGNLDHHIGRVESQDRNNGLGDVGFPPHRLNYPDPFQKRPNWSRNDVRPRLAANRLASPRDRDAFRMISATCSTYPQPVVLESDAVPLGLLERWKRSQAC